MTQENIEKLLAKVLEEKHRLQHTSINTNDARKYSDLRNVLHRKYGNIIHNVFLSCAPGSNWIMWVELSSTHVYNFQEEKNNYQVKHHGSDIDLLDGLKNDISSTILQYMTLTDEKVKDIIILNQKNLPSILPIIRTLRVFAPARPELLQQKLSDDGFYIPDINWLNRSLDRIRRSGLIVRRDDGCYFLSYKCLKDMGSIIGRNSIDIKRALAIPRRIL